MKSSCWRHNHQKPKTYSQLNPRRKKKIYELIDYVFFCFITQCVCLSLCVYECHTILVWMISKWNEVVWMKFQFFDCINSEWWKRYYFCTHKITIDVLDNKLKVLQFTSKSFHISKCSEEQCVCVWVLLASKTFRSTNINNNFFGRQSVFYELKNSRCR